REIDFALSLLPEPKYNIVENPGQNEHVNIIMQTNSAVKALAAVNEGDNRSIYDSRLINNGKVDLNDLQNNFYQTLEAEKAALKQGIIKPDDEISVLPPREAQEWYQDRVEGLMEDAD
ncbi:TPA: hypothetical protein LN607_004896, partial [Salmonella enterica subsp. enterica serovar Typhimurium]|nr:hypothetical protein [Salmonella enterica subsp. enterica serovar Typhimurium]